MWNYENIVKNSEELDSSCWHRGLNADIIAVKGDVLKYINLLQHVDMVMKGGVIYKLNGVPVEEALRPKK